MRNTLTDLNNHLFAQLERLSDEDIKGEELQEELSRAKAVSDIAAQIIANGGLALKAQMFVHDYMPEAKTARRQLPPMLRGDLLGE
jgi:hypothetical protein